MFSFLKDVKCNFNFISHLLNPRLPPSCHKLSYTKPPPLINHSLWKQDKTVKRRLLETLLLGTVITIVIFFIVLIMFLLGVEVSKAEAEAIHGDKPARGWFWYEETEDRRQKSEDRSQKIEEPKPKEPEKPVPLPVLTESKDFEFPVLDTAPPLMRKFLKEPTENNAREYLAWQFKYMQHLKKIGFTLRDAYLRFGGEIYPIDGYPENPVYSSLYFNKLKDDILRQVISRFSDRLGLLYFYSKSCPICEQQKGNIVFLKDKYNLSLRGITVDGEADYTLPFTSTYNPALLQEFKITQVPTLIAVLDKNGEARTVGLSVGYTAVDMMEQQLLRFLINEGMIEEKELNPVFIKQWAMGRE